MPMHPLTMGKSHPITSYRIRKGRVPIVRNSFIQMSKLPNVKGRISYISSHARQENLYAVYETVERGFWSKLAACNQEEFIKSGTAGECIEARELIIALPEEFVQYDPNEMLKMFTEHFKKEYSAECIAALHHNKRKTNYHIHLIFSERNLLEEPEEKIATRNMFYNENGKHVRTKKEILDKDGNVRTGCKIISKGEVYERTIFSKKNDIFKSENFLEQVKHSYTELINSHIKDERHKLTVFDKNGVYLPTKKIGKNNPKAEQIAADNELRKEWNGVVDHALVSGVAEPNILEIKHKEIGQKTKESVVDNGNAPGLFTGIIKAAITSLQMAIASVNKHKVPFPKKDVVQSDKEHIEDTENVKNVAPKLSELGAKYPKLLKVYEMICKQNDSINSAEDEVKELQKKLTEATGIFNGGKRKKIQAEIDSAEDLAKSLRKGLYTIARNNGYKNVSAFMKEFYASKAEYDAYNRAAEGANKTARKSFKSNLDSKKKESKNLESMEKNMPNKNKNKGAR